MGQRTNSLVSCFVCPNSHEIESWCCKRVFFFQNYRAKLGKTPITANLKSVVVECPYNWSKDSFYVFCCSQSFPMDLLKVIFIQLLYLCFVSSLSISTTPSYQIGLFTYSREQCLFFRHSCRHSQPNTPLQSKSWFSFSIYISLHNDINAQLCDENWPWTIKLCWSAWLNHGEQCYRKLTRVSFSCPLSNMTVKNW